MLTLKTQPTNRALLHMQVNEDMEALSLSEAGSGNKIE